MTNPRLIVTAVAGLLVGGCIGYKIAEKRLVSEFEKQLDKETNLLRRMYKPEYETPEDMVKKLHGEAARNVMSDPVYAAAVEAMAEYQNPDPVAYHKIRESGVTVVKDPAAEEIVTTRRIFEPVDDRGEIYVLTGEEYEAEEAGYEHVTWTYYAKDGVVTDIHEDRIEDYANFLGTGFVEQFGAKNDDPNVVHVRNEIVMIDYEIVRSEGSYTEEVLQEEPQTETLRPSQRFKRDG